MKNQSKTNVSQPLDVLPWMTSSRSFTAGPKDPSKCPTQGQLPVTSHSSQCQGAHPPTAPVPAQPPWCVGTSPATTHDAHQPSLMPLPPALPPWMMLWCLERKATA